LLSLPGGEVAERAPVVYQEVAGARKAVEGRFVLRGAREVGFEVGAYERDQPLVLDPLLVYSTYLGGSGGDQGLAIAVDGSGNTFITGETESTNFPTTPGSFQVTNAGFQQVFVAKLNAAGSALVYSTYLGGGGGSNIAVGIAVDASGNAYLTGIAGGDFPTVNPFQATPGDVSDAFVAKVNAAGSGLVYSSYLGGSGFDLGRAIAVDASGNAYVTGDTQSTNFPTANPLQAAPAGGRDAFVSKVNAAGSSLVYSTYLGGSDGDIGRGIAVDASGNLYVTGDTLSTDFPTANAFQPAYGGGIADVFVTKLNAAGSAFVYSTYLGGSGDDGGFAIALDASRNAYVTGFVESTDFPTVGAFDTTLGGASDAFVAKLNAAGSSLVYSTYLGGGDSDEGHSIAVGPSGSAYVTGDTFSTDFPTTNALQPTFGGLVDAFVAKVSPSGSALVYSTYLGGSSYDGGGGIALGASGNAYVAGSTSSTNFPTASPFQAANGGTVDAFVTKLGLLPPGDFNADLKADILWRNTSTGTNLVWFMNGTTLASGAFLTAVADQNWQIAATADLNDDGQTDILWRNRATGQNVAWLMNGTTLTSAVFLTAVPDLNWQIAATADFNADGSPDIVWRNRATGENVVWFMNGISLAGGAVLTPVADMTWTIAGAADFNADGKPDILWRNQSSGGNLVWFMDGTTVNSGAVLAPVSDVRWMIGAVADYNADGKPDILWRNQTSGDNLVWLMNGATIANGVVLTPVTDTNWRMAGPR
jgi:hypothetical protein